LKGALSLALGEHIALKDFRGIDPSTIGELNAGSSVIPSGFLPVVVCVVSALCHGYTLSKQF
jgi:hypothetical protein